MTTKPAPYHCIRTPSPALVLLPALALLIFFQALAVAADTGKSNVSLLTVMLPQLDRETRVWVYLPAAYHQNPAKRFPVVYMQDGQYLFDSLPLATDNPYIGRAMADDFRRRFHALGNWRVDRHLDRLARLNRMQGIIVVGIASDGGNRTAEFSPWPWRDAPLPTADRYVDFIVHTLKPYIDSHYQTYPGREYTAIAGSSMGGLVSLYAGLKYQAVFSKVAAFSPVLTQHVSGRKLVKYILRQRQTHPMSIYVDLGSAEPGFGPLEPVYKALLSAGFPYRDLWFRNIPHGTHRIEDWGPRFPQALLWLFGARG